MVSITTGEETSPLPSTLTKKGCREPVRERFPVSGLINQTTTIE